MRKTIRASLLFLLVMGAFGGTAAQSPSNQPRASGMETDVAKVKGANRPTNLQIPLVRK
jgi:hypothetical protein